MSKEPHQPEVKSPSRKKRKPSSSEKMDKCVSENDDCGCVEREKALCNPPFRSGYLYMGSLDPILYGRRIIGLV